MSRVAAKSKHIFERRARHPGGSKGNERKAGAALLELPCSNPVHARIDLSIWSRASTAVSSPATKLTQRPVGDLPPSACLRRQRMSLLRLIAPEIRVCP